MMSDRRDTVTTLFSYEHEKGRIFSCLRYFLVFYHGSNSEDERIVSKKTVLLASHLSTTISSLLIILQPDEDSI